MVEFKGLELSITSTENAKGEKEVCVVYWEGHDITELLEKTDLFKDVNDKYMKEIKVLEVEMYLDDKKREGFDVQETIYNNGKNKVYKYNNVIFSIDDGVLEIEDTDPRGKNYYDSLNNWVNGVTSRVYHKWNRY